MAFRSKTYKGEGYNELLFEDAPGQEQLNLHAQRDMNTVVLNDKTTQVGNCHSEKIVEDQHIEVHQNRQKTVGGIETQKIGQNKIEYVKGDYQHFSHLDTLLSSAEGNIIFETEGGKVTLTQDGKITILAKKIIINGQPVKINCDLKPYSNTQGRFKQKFHILSEKNSKSLKGIAYGIMVGEEIFEGFSSEEGKTNSITSDNKEQVNFIYVTQVRIGLDKYD